MSVKVNQAAILNKCLRFLNSNTGKTIVNRTQSDIERVTSLLIDCIKDNLPHSLMASSINVLSNIHIDYSYNDITQNTIVDISFDESAVYRPSLQPSIYGGVDNIIALFNNGYNAYKSIGGYWHGDYITSLQRREALHFIQNAINDFNTRYGKQYKCNATFNKLLYK